MLLSYASHRAKAHRTATACNTAQNTQDLAQRRARRPVGTRKQALRDGLEELLRLQPRLPHRLAHAHELPPTTTHMPSQQPTRHVYTPAWPMRQATPWQRVAGRRLLNRAKTKFNESLAAGEAAPRLLARIHTSPARAHALLAGCAIWPCCWPRPHRPTQLAHRQAGEASACRVRYLLCARSSRDKAVALHVGQKRGPDEI